MMLHHIAIRPSAQLAAALCIAHVAAAAAIWVVPLPAGLKAWMVLGAGLSLVWGLARTAGLHASEAIVLVEITDEGGVSFQTRGGAIRSCELLPSSYVSAGFTVLNLRPLGAKMTRHVVLVADNVNADDFRRLRAWLRWAARPDAHSGAGNA